MGGETASNSAKPSSSAFMDSWTLVITMISVVDLKAAGVYLQVSLSGDKRKQKQRTSVHEDGGVNRWLGHPFNFTVDKALAPSCCLKFKIKKDMLIWKEDVGKVDVQVTDLLEKAANGDMKPEVLSYEVRSSSRKTKGVGVGVLQFYCQLVPPPVQKVDEPVTSYPAATAPPASNSAAAYPPPTHGEASPPSGYPPAGHPPQASHPQAANPPPAEAPPPSEYLPAGHPPQASYPPAANPPPEANPPPAANLLGAVPPAEAPPPSGYLPAGHPPMAANPPGAIWPAGYPPQVLHPPGAIPQRYGHTAPQLAYQRPSGRTDFPLGFASRVFGHAISGMVGDAISGMLDSVNDA